uniref:SF3 helicase domain-containing protein n=1 Tax=viral metagenome TaxID=1070528 RepID=A0A6C0CB60_9ZZZZ
MITSYWIYNIRQNKYKYNIAIMYQHIMEKFLRPFRKCEKGDPFTHTSMIGGKWDIPDYKEDEFLKVYADEIDNGKALFMTEKHIPNNGPIVIDLDFRFAKRDHKRPVNRNVRNIIAKHLTDIVKSIFGDKHKYTCIVLQRPKRYPKEEEWSDGLHIQFPRINCKYDIQFEIRKRFMETFVIPVKCTNSYDNIYDESVIKSTNWCMFGSTKKNKEPYTMTEIHNDKKIIWDEMSTLERVKLLSIRKGGDPIKPIDKLCLKLHNKVTDKVLKNKKVIKEVPNRSSKIAVSKRDTEYNKEEIANLLGMLNKQRCNDYKEWRNVGLILHHCSVNNTNDNIDFLNMWDDWSKQSKKYEKGMCKKIWNKFTDNNEKELTLSSLYYYAQQDDPESYKMSKMSEYMNDLCVNTKIFQNNAKKNRESTSENICDASSLQNIVSDDNVGNDSSRSSNDIDDASSRSSDDVEDASFQSSNDVDDTSSRSSNDRTNKDNPKRTNDSATQSIKKNCKAKLENIKKSKQNNDDHKESEIENYISMQQGQIPIEKFKIKTLIKKQHGVIAELDTQNFCPFVKGNHKKDCMFVLFTKHGWCLKCADCPYDQYPENGLATLSDHMLQKFGVDICDDISASDSFAIYEPEHNIFSDRTLNRLVYLSLNGTATKLSELIHYLYKDRFNCIGEGAEWYEFNNHRWREGASLVLFKLISTDVPKYHTRLIKYYESIKPEIENAKTAKILMHINNVIFAATRAIKHLENMQLRNSIMQNVAATFYLDDRDFEKKLDANKYLLGFENGIYDLKTHVFRDGLPSDYVSMSVGYDYISKPNEYNKDLTEFLNSIQPCEEDRDFLLKHTSSGLCGVNREEICVVLSGKGRNGKTKYKDLVGLTLGCYFVTFDSNILTYPRPAPSAPQADLIAFKKKRFALGSEPEQKDGAIKTSFFKFITGGEMIPCRGLYDKKITEFEPTHKIGLLCNKIPNMDENDDEAVWDRTRCIEFPTKFVDNPDQPNQRKINRDLKESLPLWKQDFMLVLIEKYKEYQKTGLITTQKIMQFTKSYKDDNDIYLQFLNDCTTASKTHVHMSTLYDCFTTWFRRDSPNQKIPSKKMFCAGLRNHRTIETVRVDNKITTGIKFIIICDELNNSKSDVNYDLLDE